MKSLQAGMWCFSQSSLLKVAIDVVAVGVEGGREVLLDRKRLDGSDGGGGGHVDSMRRVR